MRGYLERRGATSWRLKVFAGRDEAGRARYVSRTVRGTKREAQRALAALITEVVSGSYAAAAPASTPASATSDGMTVTELLDRWLTRSRDNLSPSTVIGYERVIARYLGPRFGQRLLTDLRADELERYYLELRADGGRGRPLQPRTIIAIAAVLRRAYNYALRHDLVERNPVAVAELPKVHRAVVMAPTPAEIRRLVEAAEARDPAFGCFLRLAATSGARRGELCALRWCDVDLDGATLTIARSVVGNTRAQLVEKDTKTHGVRRLSLDAATVHVMTEQRRRARELALSVGVSLAADAFVFSDAVDFTAPWRPDRVTSAFVRLRDEVGLRRIRLHDMRHFAATHLLAAGVPVRTVAGRLGHADASVTLDVYAHFVSESDHVAAQLLGDLLADQPRQVERRGNRRDG